jgi:hypothetical protein
LRIARACELAGDKAVVNLIDSASFPMPKETDALEHLMAKRLRVLSAEQRDTARNMVNARIDAAPAVRETMLGDLVAVSLRKNIPVSKQVKALPIPADIKLALTEIASVKPMMSPMASAAVVNGHKKLTLEYTALSVSMRQGPGGSSAPTASATTKSHLGVLLLVLQEQQRRSNLLTSAVPSKMVTLGYSIP